jgi:hypothetical protein
VDGKREGERPGGASIKPAQLFDLAIEDFDEAIRLNPAIGHGPEYALALFGRGMSRRRNGNPTGLSDIEEATRLFPHVAEAMADLDDH